MEANAWLEAHPHHQAKMIALSAMAESVLGKPLNKALQTYNWDARPLSRQQMMYAAMDAHVLLQIYETICKQPGAKEQAEGLAETWRG